MGKMRPWPAGWAAGTVLGAVVFAVASAARAQGAGLQPADTPSGAVASNAEGATVRVLAVRGVAAVDVGGETFAVPVAARGSGAVFGVLDTVVTDAALVEGAPVVLVRRTDRGESFPAVVAGVTDDGLAFLATGAEFGGGLEPTTARDEVSPPVGARAFVVACSGAAFDATPAAIPVTVLVDTAGNVRLGPEAPPVTAGGPVIDESGRLIGVAVFPRGEGSARVVQTIDLAQAYAALAAEGALAEARRQAFSPDWPGLRAVSLVPRTWTVGAGGEGAGAPASVTDACGLLGDSADAETAQEAAPSATGALAMLVAGARWNALVCDLHALGMTMADLLAPAVVERWTTGAGHAALNRVAEATAAYRAAVETAPEFVEASTFAATLAAFDARVWEVVDSLRAVPAGPPDVAAWEGPSGPIPPPVAPPPQVEMGAPAEVVTAEAEAGGSDPDPERLLFVPTALTLQKGTWNVRALGLGYWTFGYGVTDSTTLGFATSLPIMQVGVFPIAKIAGEVAPGVHFGVDMQAGFWFPYWGGEVDLVLAVYGGGLTLTLGHADRCLNVSMRAYGGTLFDEGTTSSGAVLSPNVGGAVRLGRIVKASVELHVPLFLDEDGDKPWEFGTLWALLYGVRIFGDFMYGDVGFALPIEKEMGGTLSYLPLGFPYLDFGFTW